MAEVQSGLSMDQINAAIASSIAAIPNAFINGGAEQTVASLLTNFPADASMLYKYARVSDLYGTARSVMICEASAGSFYWRPQRTDFSAASAATSGTVTLTPLLTAPVMVFTGTLLGSITIQPSSTNAWPGATFTVMANGVLGLFNINISGLIGGGTVPLLTGGSRTVTYIQGAGWRAA